MSTEKKRPQLNLDELHQLRWLLSSLLTLLSVWTVWYLEIDAWVLMGLTTLTVGASLIWPQLPARVPGFVHVAAFPAVVAFFLIDIWLKGEVLSAIVRLNILLLLYRSLGYRRRREDLQVIVLGLFLVVVAGVLTVSLAFAAQILVFTACALTLLLVLTLVEAAEDGLAASSAQGAPGAPPAWSQVHWPRLLARLQQATDWRLMALAGAMFVGVVALSALLFLSLPRFQLDNSLFLERLVTRKARTGFSDSIKFGDVTEIQQDNSIALMVDVSDPSQVPISPYWRMLVLDRYEKGAFKMSYQGISGTTQRSERELRGKVYTLQGEPVYWKFYLEAGTSRYLPLLGPFHELRFSERQNYRYGPQFNVLALAEDPATMTAYRVEGFDLSGTLFDPDFDRNWEGRLTAESLPPIVEEATSLKMLDDLERAALAQMVAQFLPAEPGVVSARTGDDFISRANAWLRQNHGYSLKPSIPGAAGDPVVRWLKSRNPGHCELFAGSLVLLARTAGFPARVVTGFRGGAWNGYANNLTVRNADAHAWAEIFDSKTGAWLRADALGEPTTVATTAAAGEMQRAARVERGWAARLESLRIFWYRRIVSFDQRTQIETLEAVKEVTESSGRELREALAAVVAAVKRWFAGPWDARRFAVVLAWSLVFLSGWWLWREYGAAYWTRWMRRLRGRHDDPVRTDAGRWLVRMAEAEKTAEAPEVVAQLQRLRFGARTTWPEPKRVFRSARHALRSPRRRRSED